MARLVIFGELGSSAVNWYIPNFLDRIKEIDEAPSNACLSFESELCTLKLYKKSNNCHDTMLRIYHQQSLSTNGQVSQTTKNSIISYMYNERWGSSWREIDIKTETDKFSLDTKFPRMIRLADG